MRIPSASGTPAFTVPVAGSVLISQRFNNSSTECGPSVNAGVTAHAALVETPEVDVDDGDVAEPGRFATADRANGDGRPQRIQNLTAIAIDNVVRWHAKQPSVGATEVPLVTPLVTGRL